MKYIMDLNNLNENQIKTLYDSRVNDIKNRGEEHYVYNLNGDVVMLKDANIWHKNGVYVKPLSSEQLYCIIS